MVGPKTNHNSSSPERPTSSLPGCSPSMSAGNGNALDVDARVRLMRDGVINNAGLVASGVVSLILVPFLLKGLGAEAYGLWIAALVLAGLMGMLDVGLGTSVIREVAATLSTDIREETTRFVAATGNAYLVIGLVGALLITILGVPLSAGMHLSARTRQLAFAAFFLAGLTFAADQLGGFATSILRGLRRFDASNLIAIAGVLLRAAGVIVLLSIGAGLVAVAAWYAVAAGVTAVVGLAVVSRLGPRFRFRLGYFSWASLRAHIPFGIASQIASGLINVVWSAAPLLIGVVLGSSWVVPYYIGQKFPLAVSGLTWRAGEVLFPAASEHERAKNLPGTREVLEVGTRWIVVLALPICTVLFIVAPTLLRAWVGEAQPDTVLVLRLTTAAVLANALGEGALYWLWGRGAMKAVLRVVGGMAILSVGLTLGLLPRLGIVGAAWVLLGTFVFGWFALLGAAAQERGVRVFHLVRAVAQGLLLPFLACAVPTLAIALFASEGGWPAVAGSSLLAGSAYAAALYLHGSREEERAIIEWPAKLAVNLVRSFCRGRGGVSRHT
jgi:O-antigen/teichoic acid export membrane protein